MAFTRAAKTRVFCLTRARADLSAEMARHKRPDLRYALFDTPLGRSGIAWSNQGIVRLQLPEADEDATVFRLLQGGAGVIAARPPSWVKHAIEAVVSHLNGELQDFSALPVDLRAVTPFERRVYAQARATKAGQTITYGELAAVAGAPGAARAVGRALGANPVALIVPCHRVVAARGRMGGFSAHGGKATKAKLLAIEGVLFPADDLTAHGDTGGVVHE